MPVCFMHTKMIEQMACALCLAKRSRLVGIIVFCSVVVMTALSAGLGAFTFSSKTVFNFNPAPGSCDLINRKQFNLRSRSITPVCIPRQQNSIAASLFTGLKDYASWKKIGEDFPLLLNADVESVLIKRKDRATFSPAKATDIQQIFDQVLAKRSKFTST